ncbi:HNH endonuclease family protein [Actinocrispum sp. NPDC049592]|uniref:HNH endonuclease family protein n=1 Tax=Actinocrispum sp. NPDC049592 TaxID=3154835 RepID=UPI00341CCFC9
MARKRKSAPTTLGGAVALLLLISLAVWWANRDQSTASAPPPAPSNTPALASLVVAPAGPMTGYSRDRFPLWASGPDSCDTRETVLQKQGSGVTRNGQCKAVSGTWTSPYDGVVITDAAKVDIDHVVPLAEAWRSGAASWTDEQRKQFANDLTNPQLFAVSANANRSKGDKDPAEWKPPAQGFWCTYARDYVTVKAAYKLTVDQAEHDALAQMLGTCPN